VELDLAQEVREFVRRLDGGSEAEGDGGTDQGGCFFHSWVLLGLIDIAPF
jgi:hypothetical protein